MGLPIVKQPTYTTKTKELGNVKFRPFVNAEHKALLTTIDLGDEKSSFNTILDIVDTCTFKAVKTNNLAPHLLEFLFLQAYIKSVENKVNGSYNCRNKLTAEQFEKRKAQLAAKQAENPDMEPVEPSEYCDSKFNVVIPIEDATIMYPDNYDEASLIDIDGVNKIKLKIPSAVIQVDLDEMLKAAQQENSQLPNIDAIFLYHGIDYIETANGKLTQADFTIEDFIEWYDDLHVTITNKITKFYSDAPKLHLTQVIKCPMCGNSETMEFTGLKSFFT